MNPGDGNGWTHCALGHRHWGLHGAAGLLITDSTRVLLQERDERTHEGGTWAVPGGARDSHETVVQAAVREATEETDLDATLVRPYDEWVDDHGGWSYTTVVATAPASLVVRPANWESTDVRWWSFDEVRTLRLHSGFAKTWPSLLPLLRAPRVG